MPLFPLDSVQNASIDQEIELVLEDVREEVVSFPFQLGAELGDAADVLEVYDLARPRLNVLVALLRDLGGSTGADISTGFGFLPPLLVRSGLTTIATEQDPTLASFASAHGVEVRPFTIGRMPPPFAAASLDFLVLAEVLEHLKLSGVFVMREMAQLLRTGGRLVVTTPNVARLEHVEALIAGENFLEPFPEDLPPGSDPTDFVEHVREYSVRELVDAVEAAGLAVDRVLMTGWGDAGYHLLANPYVNEIVVLVATK